MSEYTPKSNYDAARYFLNDFEHKYKSGRCSTEELLVILGKVEAMIDLKSDGSRDSNTRLIRKFRRLDIGLKAVK